MKQSIERGEGIVTSDIMSTTGSSKTRLSKISFQHAESFFIIFYMFRNYNHEALVAELSGPICMLLHMGHTFHV